MDNSNKIIWSAVFILLVFEAALGVCQAGTVQSFPLPIAELKQVTQTWLSQVCHDMSDRELEIGIIQFTCKRNDQQLQVTLTPRSALATEIAIRDAHNDSTAVEFKDQLAAHIDTYLNKAAQKDGSATKNAQTPATVLAKSDAVVCIQSENEDSSIQVSGFMIDQNGTIICTTHGLRQFKTITFSDSQGRVHEGTVVKSDPQADLALIRTTIKPRVHISLAKGKRTLQKGAPVYAIGCPGNQANTVTAGTVNKPPVRANQLVYWQVNMKILPGSSGSPVFDSQGTLIGMIRGRYREDNAIGFLIPADRIKHFIDEF